MSRFVVYAHFFDRPPKVVLETDDLAEAEQFQLEHRRGRGLGSTAVSSAIIDREQD